MIDRCQYVQDSPLGNMQIGRIKRMHLVELYKELSEERELPRPRCIICISQYMAGKKGMIIWLKRERMSEGVTLKMERI